MIKGLIQQYDKTGVNIFTPKRVGTKYIKQISIDTKTGTDTIL